MARPVAPGSSIDRKGFWGLNVAQFLGAFNDNAWETMLQLLAMATVAESAQRIKLVSLAQALFLVPFLLFSMYAGALADRYSKRSVLIASKVAEVAVMGCGVLAFLAGGSFALLFAVLFLKAAQSAFYGPSKYGVLPEILPETRLSWGNGIMQMATFVAIILGTVAGSAPFRSSSGERAGFAVPLWVFALLLTASAVVGCLSSLLIPRVPPADPGRRIRFNPLGELWAEARTIASHRVLRLTVLGIIYLWFFGIMARQNILLHGKEAMGLSEQAIGGLLTALALGVGLGCVAAGYLSGKTIELGLVPLGALGLFTFSIALVLTTGSFAWTAADLVLLGVSGGFFIVPLNSLLQEESPPKEKGSMIAASQVFTFGGMALATLVFYVLTVPLGLSTRAVFVFLGVTTLLGTAYILRLLPEALGRFILWILTHSVYRVRVLGRENLPDRGAALLVSNHVSYIDGLLVLAATHRFIRFVMYKAIADLPLVRQLARLMRVIPISSEEGPRAVLSAVRASEEALRQGELVCIFPEGQISRTGQMLPFREGFERMVKNVDVPLVPVHLDRVWGSIFSFQGGRFLWKLPRRWPYPVTVSFGKPLPHTASALEVRQAVAELGSAAYAERKRDLRPLERGFIRTARRQWRRRALADSSGASLTFGGALQKSLGLARRLREHWRGQEQVGLLLPPSVAGALANVAALLAGRIPVNLNYTASAESMRSAAAQCGLATVLTSRAFLEKAGVESPVRPVFIEDLAAPAPAGQRLLLWLAAALAPAGFLTRLAGNRRPPDVDAVATILFSSGSTGEPKGVLLTHANLLSNIQALEQLFEPDPGDSILGVLPFFHSFGLMGTLWFPLVSGFGAVYHPNPLDAKAIAALVREHSASYLVTTPTFLQTYTRRCEPDAFGSLRHVVVGAERLPDRVRDAFRERFGIEPLEGYGSTECSPLVAVNVPDHRERGIHQVGSKRGRIGHPIPGVSVRVVDPESLEPLPQGREGLLLVKGPNVMAGYLGRPDLTAQAIRDGWYVTGDLAVVDDDGFIAITDRMARFSKIAGEMVPHVKVEELLHQALGASEQVLAVTGVPDGQKGERLAVIHTLDEPGLARLLEKLPALGLPNLWLPRREAFVRVDALPHLGTGKMDLRRIRQMAEASMGTTG